MLLCTNYSLVRLFRPASLVLGINPENCYKPRPTVDLQSIFGAFALTNQSCLLAPRCGRPTGHSFDPDCAKGRLEFLRDAGSVAPTKSSQNPKINYFCCFLMIFLGDICKFEVPRPRRIDPDRSCRISSTFDPTHFISIYIFFKKKSTFFAKNK